MKVMSWSRGDQLFLEGVLWVLPAVVLLDVGVRLVGVLRGTSIESTGELPAALASPGEPVTGPVSGAVVVHDPSAAQYAWSLAPAVLLLVLAVVAARLLLGVVRALRTGDPFTTANARRLTALSALVLVGGVGLPFVAGLAHAAVLAPLLAPGARSLSFDIALWPALPGLFIAFLAEVFSRGARLREEVEGLV